MTFAINIGVLQRLHFIPNVVTFAMNIGVVQRLQFIPNVWKCAHTLRKCVNHFMGMLLGSKGMKVTYITYQNNHAHMVHIFFPFTRKNCVVPVHPLTANRHLRHSHSCSSPKAAFLTQKGPPQPHLLLQHLLFIARLDTIENTLPPRANGQ